MFVKPARSGSSVGISKVTDWDELPAAVELARTHDAKVIIEAGVVGREIEVGVLEGVRRHTPASVPAEIRLVRGHEWYNFEAKYLDDACEFDVPADARRAHHGGFADRGAAGVRGTRLRRAGAGRLLPARRTAN